MVAETSPHVLYIPRSSETSMLRTRKNKQAVSQVVAALVVVIIILAVVAGVAFTRAPSTSTTTVNNTEISTSVSTSTATSVSTFGTASINSTVLAAAQAECNLPGVTNCLTVVTTISAAAWSATLLPAFLTEFPWATGKVTINSVSSTTYATTVLAAYNANKVTADTLTGSAAIFFAVIQGGAVANYKSNMLGQLGYTSDTFGPNYATTSIQPAVLLYNPTYLKNHNIPIPTTWQNLTNPIYKGLLTMQNPATLSNVGLEMYWLSYNFGYTNSTWNSLMKGIAANNPIITTDPVISTAQVYTSQAAIGVGIIYNDYTAVINNGSSGANPNNLAIDMQGQFGTAPIAPGLVGVAANAPHPAMGELMEDWLLSPPGQYALGLTAHVPLYQPVAIQLNEIPAGLTIVSAVQNPAIETDTASWSTLFHNIFG